MRNLLYLIKTKQLVKIMWLQLLLILIMLPSGGQTEMVQTYTCVDQNVNIFGYIQSVSDDYDLFSFGTQSMVFDGTYFYVVITAWKSTTDLGVGNFLLRYDSNWGNVFELWKSEKPTWIPSTYLKLAPSITYFGDPISPCIYVEFYITESGGSHETFVESNLWDITTSTPTVSSDTVSADARAANIIRGRDVNHVWLGEYASGAYNPNSFIVVYGSDTTMTQTSYGWIDETTNDYYYLGTDGTSVFLRKITPLSSISTVETISSSGGSDLELPTALYWKQDDVEIAMWTNHLFYKGSSTSSWKQIMDLTATNPIPFWKYNSTINEFFVNSWSFGTKYIEIIGKGVVLSTIENISIISAWDSFFISTDGTIYKRILTSNENIVIGSIQTKIYSAPAAQITTIVEPITNEYLELYDDSSNLLFQGWVLTNLNNGDDTYDFKLRSPVEQDLKARVQKTYTGQTADEILKDVIDTYCLFLYYTTHITARSNTYDKEFKNTTVLEVIKWADQAEGYQTSIRPSHEVYYDLGEDLTGSVSISEETDLMDFSKSDRTRQDLKISILTGTGDWDAATGKRFVATYQGEANYASVSDWYPWIKSQAELQTHVNTVGASRNQILDIFDFTIIGKGMLKNGTIVALTSPTFGLTADSVYVIGTNYDIMSGACESILYDKLIGTASVNEMGESTEDNGKKIENCEQAIDNTNARVDAVSASSHAAVTISGTSPLSISTQALSIKNDDTNAITTIEADSIDQAVGGKLKIPSSYAVGLVKTTADAALPKLNDVGGTITEIDTGTLDTSDTKIPTNGTVKEAVDLKAALADAMIGAANKVFYPCIYMNDNPPDVFQNDGGGISNAGATDGYGIWTLPLPFTRNSLKLYGCQVRITTKQADGSNYITQEYVFGNTSGAATSLQSSLTDINSATTTTRAFTTNPSDLSGYNSVVVFIDTVNTTANALRIYGVEIEVYYA